MGVPPKRKLSNGLQSLHQKAKENLLELKPAAQQAKVIVDATKKTTLRASQKTKETLSKIEDATRATTQKATLRASLKTKETLGKIEDVTQKATKRASQIITNPKETLEETARKVEKTTKKAIEKFKKSSSSSFHRQSSSKNSNDDNVDLDDDPTASHEGVPAVEPDETIQKMKLILRKRVMGMSVEEFYNLSQQTDFYEKWLQSEGNTNIEIGDWEEVSTEGSVRYFLNYNWNQDNTPYEQRRTATFQVHRSTPLFTGSAQVQQTQWSLLQPHAKNQKCIVQVQIELPNIPIANNLNVQIRWVVTQLTSASESPMVLIQVGMHMHFMEPALPLLERKIRSEATKETIQTQKSLFKAILSETSASVVCGNNNNKNSKSGTVIEHDDDELPLLVLVEEDDDDEDGYFGSCCGSFSNLIFCGGDGGWFSASSHSNAGDNDPTTPLIKANAIQKEMQQVVQKLDHHQNTTPSNKIIDTELDNMMVSIQTIQMQMKMIKTTA